MNRSRRQQARCHRGARSPVGLIVRYAVLLILVAFAVFPVIWLAVTSLRSQRDILSGALVPSEATLTNYFAAFDSYDFSYYMVNSIVVTGVTVAVVTVLSVPAAYSLARFRLPGRGVVLAVLLLVRMIPIIALAIPLFEIFAKIGLLDTWMALILAQTAAKLPIATWLAMGFIEGVPHELEESAKIDGASTMGTLVRIVTPLVAPGIAAAAVLTFIFTWNDLLVALTLTSSPMAQTLPVGLTNFIGLYGIEWGPMAAAGMLMIIPTVIFVWIAQRHLVSGLAAGAVK